eukprot:gene3896-4858_t
MSQLPTPDFESIVTPVDAAQEVKTHGGVNNDEDVSGSRLDDWWSRNRTNPLWHRLFAWGTPALVIVTAAITRLWNLGHPASLVFDETLYVKDAWTLWNLGYEASWPAEADTLFNGGNANIFHTDASFVVHPRLGKWIIAIGM